MALNIRNYSLLCNQGTAKFNEDVGGTPAHCGQSYHHA